LALLVLLEALCARRTPDSMATAVAPAWRPMESLASGAHPTSTFPNAHLLPTGAAAACCVVEPPSLLAELRSAVWAEDWERRYEEGRTRICLRPEWSASEEHCALLQVLVRACGARRVLEIGSFCGVGALALAEALPEDGQVLALELDEFSVALGRRFHARSPAGRAIRTVVGKAEDALRDLARRARLGREPPFDLVVVDADRARMAQYFGLVSGTPGLLSANALVCVDTMLCKGEAPIGYAPFGFPHRWEAASGEEHIAALREMLRSSPEFYTHELAGLLIVRRAP